MFPLPLYLNFTKGLMIFQSVLYNWRKTVGTEPSLLAQEGRIKSLTFSQMNV